MRGIESSSSSVESVGKVKLITDAAEDAGSKDGTLDRIEGIEIFDNVRNGHLCGISGDTGLVKSWLGRGVTSILEGVVDASGSLESGDFLSDPLRSLPFPKTVFLSDPFLLRLLCESPLSVRPSMERWLSESPSSF